MWRLNVLFFFVACTSALNLKQIKEEFFTSENFTAAKVACMKELNLTPNDLMFDKENSETNEKLLCFGKCIEKEQGLIDEDGVIIIEKVKEMSLLKAVDEEQKTQIIECLEELGKVADCQDVQKERDCFHKVMN